MTAYRNWIAGKSEAGALDHHLPKDSAPDATMALLGGIINAVIWVAILRLAVPSLSAVLLAAAFAVLVAITTAILALLLQQS